MKRIALALCLAALATPTLHAQDAPGATTSARKRVAVLDFDYATVHGYVSGIMGSDVDIGKGVATMLVSELVRNGTYTVMERAQVDRILNEQNFQQGGRADASSAAKLGRLLGVDAIIIGSITQFERVSETISFGFRKSSKAIVAIDARVVQIGTGEIMAVAQGKGQSERTKMNLETDADVAEGRRLSQDMWSANLASTIIGEATRAAVTNLVTTLAAAAPKIQETETAVVVSALVADVSGSELIINVGTLGGVKLGSEYAVLRPGREIKDPATGNVLRRTTTPVGKIKITSVVEASAVGTLTGLAALVGDCVGACPLGPVAVSHR
jgi:curli biogenesis system outer membrane secretion channel CsgG